MTVAVNVWVGTSVTVAVGVKVGKGVSVGNGVAVAVGKLDVCVGSSVGRTGTGVAFGMIRACSTKTELGSVILFMVDRASTVTP